MTSSILAFSLAQSDVAQFAPRLGLLSYRRDTATPAIEIKIPGAIATSSRGIIPHLSRDHVRSTGSIQWVNIPFESFLDRVPPVITLQTGPEPLHTFLGYDRRKHILSMTVRDPLDVRDMPANGKDHISAQCIRGVRKVTPSSWNSYSQACKPDVFVALADIPHTQAPQSQKRLQKSLERSAAWLAHLIGSAQSQPSDVSSELTDQRPSVLVNLVGGTEERARTAFSESLLEVLHGKEQEQISPLRTLDEGVAGYQLELVSLRRTLRAEHITQLKTSDDTKELSSLMQASLIPLPSKKLRIVYGAQSPHEILCFIRNLGLDLFDTHWAQRAADIGVALDFTFPAPSPSEANSANDPCPRPKFRTNGTMDIGHNLFDSSYAHDHNRLASSFLDGASSSRDDSQSTGRPCCTCRACSPLPSETTIIHDGITQAPEKPISPLPPYTRSYIHHLLHTHEMSSHSLLVMHNLAIIDGFFRGIREVIHLSQTDPGLLAREIELFVAAYSHPDELFAEAEKDWAKVESERGKGRLAREREKQEAEVTAAVAAAAAKLVESHEEVIVSTD
ncbi:hypothetical protein EIP91_006580 [Steccherinum ochraceum]|uniref:tRNA-guanine(15) transglycosylase-like domain-containing protein n=1 Tax=Steccherinum ochraceum TaxID=92696 RepID=A0A4R0RG38_9APHY|nr:hypothetical protein EIP91_006580 [Steccherinum ochraceum]